MNGKTAVRQYGDPARLIESIREESARRIGLLEQEVQAEIQRIDEECAGEIRSFREARESETDGEIERAVYIMKNRAVIEKRKLRLNAVEEFMRIMVKEAVSGFVQKDREGYVNFLKIEILAALAGREWGDVVIHLRPEDAGIESEILDAIERADIRCGKIVFAVDNAATGGGAVVEDVSRGLSCNRSLDRIVARAYDEIRKEVAAIVQKHVNAFG